MCTSGGRSARQEQINVADQRSLATTYRTSDFIGGRTNLTRNVKPPKEILDRARYASTMNSNRTFNGQELAPGQLSPVDRMKFGGSINPMTAGQGAVSKGVSKKGAWSVSNTGDISYRGQSGRSYKANYTAYGLQGGAWQIGGAGKGKSFSFKTEDEARALWKDFGRDFDTDPMRGKYYKTVDKGNPLRRQRVRDEGKIRRKTRALRADQSALQGNAARKGKKGGNFRIEKAGAQVKSSGSGINIGR